MKDRIKQSIKLDWQKIKPLQPENVKLPYNTQHLKKSLLKYGFSLPFYVWESEGEYYCIDGHHRLDVLNELISEGHKVPKELNAVEIEAKDRKEAISILVSVFNQKSNPFAEEYLIEFLEVENIDIQEVNIESVNVVTETIEEETVLEAIEDDFDSTPPTEAITVLGDLYEIGEHRLLCGDSTDSDAVVRLMDGKIADLLLTDPPYGIGIDGQKESKAKNPKHNRKGHEFRNWDNERPDQSTFDFLLLQADKAIIWGGNYFADLLPASRGWLYWSKGQDGLTMSDGELAWTTEDKPLRCITVNRAALQGSVHPTQKPVKVIDFCIDYAGSPNLIIDAYCGSGSTMVAAHQLKRKCYGMELDPKYCDVIVKRIIKLDPTLNIKRNGVVIDKKEFE
jgi:hypothetical protein